MSNDINVAINFAMQKCWDENVGYSQTTRYLNPNVDCSALVYYALQAGGFSVPAFPWYTRTARATFLWNGRRNSRASTT